MYHQLPQHSDTSLSAYNGNNSFLSILEGKKCMVVNSTMTHTCKKQFYMFSAQNCPLSELEDNCSKAFILPNK